MEGYKKLFREASTPSSLLFFIVCITILCSYKKTTSDELIYGFIAVFFILLLISFWEVIKQLSFHRRSSFVLLFIAIITIYSTVSIHIYNKVDALITSNTNEPSIQNCMVTITEVNKKRYSQELYFTSKIKESTMVKGVLLYRGWKNFRAGDTLVIHKKIKQIANDKNSGYGAHLRRKGINYTGFINDKSLTVTQVAPPSFKEKKKKKLLNRIDKLFKQHTSSLLKALYTGNRSIIEKTTLINFRDAGVLHVLAASGLHVGIIAAIPLLLLFLAFNKKTVSTISLILVICYLYLTDAPVSLIRASIMFSLFYLQSLFDRERNILNILMLTGAFILILHPWELFNPGFQLSFGATVGIIIFYKQYKSSLTGFPGPIKNSFALTLSAQVLTIPCILYHMNQINLIGLLSNLLIIPLISLIMIFSLLSISLSIVSITVALKVSAIVEILHDLITQIASTAASLGLNFYIEHATLVLIFFYALTLLPLVRINIIKKLRYYPIIASLIGTLIYLKAPSAENKNLMNLSKYKSMAKITTSKEIHTLTLNFKETSNINNFTENLKKNNIPINKIKLSNCSFANMLASEKIIRNFNIQECIIPEKIIGTGNLDGLLQMTNIDKIKITVKTKDE